MIEDTSKRDPLVHLIGSMGGSSSSYIEDMEAEGQKQLVAAAGEKGELFQTVQIPVDRRGCDEQMQADGFVFVKHGADIFDTFNLPAGWRLVPTDHSMWSDILDADGKPRYAIFYKAAFYDRNAHLLLVKQDS